MSSCEKLKSFVRKGRNGDPRLPMRESGGSLRACMEILQYPKGIRLTYLMEAYQVYMKAQQNLKEI